MSATVLACRPVDRVLVLGFGSSVSRVAEVAGGARLDDALLGLAAGGKTRLDLALDEAAEWLRSQGGRPHILLLTDGDPTDADGRRVRGEPFIDRARGFGRAGVRLTVVGLGTAEGYDASFLRSLADAAGGLAFVGVPAGKLVQRTLDAIRSGAADTSDVDLVVDSAELTVLEAWRVEPRVQPLSLVEGMITLPTGSGGAVLLRTQFVQGLGGRRGERQVGILTARIRGGAETSSPLVLNIVGPGALERSMLNTAIDRLRVKVELARTAQMRAAADDREDQHRLTRRLADLVDQLDDPRATMRIRNELTKLDAGAPLDRDERESTVDVLRGGHDDG